MDDGGIPGWTRETVAAFSSVQHPTGDLRLYYSPYRFNFRQLRHGPLFADGMIF